MNEELRKIIEWWCAKVNEPIPIDEESIERILARMESIGIITTEEKIKYSQSK